MATDSKIEDFAEELGKLLGTAQNKAESWLGQRKQIAKTLEGIRDTAARLLTDLGHEAAGAATAFRRGRGSENKIVQPVTKRKRRKMSAAARAKSAAANRTRAKVKASKK